ncbi:antibiotic biosynthesis monooxygenase family protein [Marinicellulosiphila megalodicopiae]|uniref:antibiotic biosynthesis monooxygenase family protein n=1 Tax=Marinicellulosiphila megalodicopiae TaxID=2724896 RepID=UPI003BAE6AF9
MYAVIFKAKINSLDKQYTQMAKQMRDLAISHYGCTDFIATTQDDNEIAVSYWPDLESIKKWKQDFSHLKAQKLGAEKWYKHYEVEVVEILRHYQSLA